MPESAPFRLIGRGVYSLTEAERLTRIPRKRLRRWTVGYQFRKGLERRWSPPLIAETMQAEVGVTALDFADLMEVRFLENFRAHGVSWATIRLATERARALLGVHHPFSSRKFKTDGRHILAEVARDRREVPDLFNLVSDQYEFERLVSPLLYAGIEFDEDGLVRRWWPLGQDREVLIDPARSFGAPIVRQGVPTGILDDAVRAEGSIEAAADWYQVRASAIEDALEFERSHGALRAA